MLFIKKKKTENFCNSLCTFTVLKLVGAAVWFVTKIMTGQMVNQDTYALFCQRNTISLQISQKDTFRGGVQGQIG